jgi:hypothetical protein
MKTMSSNRETAQKYIEFQCYPNRFVISKAVETNEDIRKALRSMPEDAVGFRFFMSSEMRKDDYGRTAGNRIYNSGWFYIDGHVMTLDEIRKQMPNKRILIANIEDNAWQRVVFTRKNTVCPFWERDMVVENPLRQIYRI